MSIQRNTYRSDGSKGHEAVVKGNVIDGKDVGLMTVTFEGKAILARDLLQVMNPDTSFDTTDRKACLVGEARDATRLVLERRILAGIKAYPNC